MKKNVIIIGAAKSGTSTLMEHMDEHENVNTSAGKEPRYFCDGYYEEYLKRGIEYESLWEEDKGNVYLEASTGYTKYPAVTGAAENMEEYGINPKIIYIVRDPIERMISHARYMMWREENINMEYLRESCVAASMYYTQSKRYLDRFGKERMKIIKIDGISNNTEETVKDIFEFIGESTTKKIENKKKNVSKNVTKLELIIRKSPVWKLKSFIPGTLKKKTRNLWSLFSESPHKDVIDGIEKAKIRKMCQDALQLEDLFRIDLEPWRENIARSELLD